MADDEKESSYPRSLNGTGCIFGRNLKTSFEDHSDREEKLMDRFEAKLTKVLWALVGVLITLATSTVFLAANLLGG